MSDRVHICITCTLLVEALSWLSFAMVVVERCHVTPLKTYQEVFQWNCPILVRFFCFNSVSQADGRLPKGSCEFSLVPRWTDKSCTHDSKKPKCDAAEIVMEVHSIISTCSRNISGFSVFVTSHGNLQLTSLLWLVSLILAAT